MRARLDRNCQQHSADTPLKATGSIPFYTAPDSKNSSLDSLPCRCGNVFTEAQLAPVIRELLIDIQESIHHA